MGGRGSSSYAASRRSGVVVMSEDEFLASKGVGDVLSGYMDDKTRLPHGETARQKATRQRQANAAASANFEKRKAARAEYRKLVESGKVRTPTAMEKRLRTAQGDPSNKAVQAARRVLTKRGIDWRTGKKL